MDRSINIQAFYNALVELQWDCSNLVFDLFLGHKFPSTVYICIIDNTK